jgi:hypothetical protein
MYLSYNIDKIRQLFKMVLLFIMHKHCYVEQGLEDHKKILFWKTNTKLWYGPHAIIVILYLDQLLLKLLSSLNGVYKNSIKSCIFSSY